MTDIVVSRRYLERGVERVERITWRHVPDPPPRWTFQKRRFRRPKPVLVQPSPDLDDSRPLPAWADPGLIPNRWAFMTGADVAADLAWVEPDSVDADGTKYYGPASLYWSPYEIPLRAGCVLL